MTSTSASGSSVAIIFLILCLVRTSQAIWLTLPSSGTKCVSEEIQNNVVVLADYVVIPDDHSHSPTISAKVFWKPKKERGGKEVYDSMPKLFQQGFDDLISMGS